MPRGIARAWRWRRKLEPGEASTLFNIAQAEDVTDRYVSRMIRLAYLAPALLEKFILERSSPTMSVKDLAAAADLAWKKQETAVFG